MAKKKINRDFVIRFLNAIGRGKVKFKQKQEILINCFHFRKFSTEWDNFRMVLGVELGEIKKVVSVKRTNVVTTGDRDWWDSDSLGKREKNPWDECSDAARCKIDECLRVSDEGLIKVEKKWIITHNGVPVGHRLERGTIRIGKTQQLSFPEDACKFHDTHDSANISAEKLRKYLSSYNEKKTKRKR